MTGHLLSIFDMRDDNGEAYFDLPHTCPSNDVRAGAAHQPHGTTSLSLCETLRAIGGDAGSGAQRENLTREIEDLLRRTFVTMMSSHGEEYAVLRLFEIMAGATTYTHPAWALDLFHLYRAELMQEFAGTGGEQVMPDHDPYDGADDDGTPQWSTGGARTACKSRSRPPLSAEERRVRFFGGRRSEPRAGVSAPLQPDSAQAQIARCA